MTAAGLKPSKKKNAKLLLNYIRIAYSSSPSSVSKLATSSPAGITMFPSPKSIGALRALFSAAILAIENVDPKFTAPVRAIGWGGCQKS